ncbi:uncharacterized protein LOC111625145 [Centruroides sculpturatus]|uniref:uncharacterized protein LOC111625145 n=1 Tax=Centruroides sculpturatus TaxID=218467 RepID=UPI000C6CE740|nr:uncharacterized protein LOC111625145 [Centruroides sculpturatus]
MESALFVSYIRLTGLSLQQQLGLPFCTSYAGSKTCPEGLKVTFHEIPSNEQLRQKWLNVISRQGNKKYLQAQHDKNALKLKAYEEDNLIEAVGKIAALTETENTGAVFLVDQVLNFDKRCPKWSNDVIRECILCKVKSPKGYDHARVRKRLCLPSI